MRVPPANLGATVSRYNELMKQGIDLDFQAFSEKTFRKPKPIDTPPFYAARFFPSRVLLVALSARATPNASQAHELSLTVWCGPTRGVMFASSR